MPTDSLVKKSWRNKFYKLKRPFNPVTEIEKEKQPSPTDTVMKHPNNGSNIRIKDSGAIQLFGEKGVGIKIDPNSGSIQFYGDKSIFNTSYINFNTDRRGLRWNYQPFNQSLANPLKQVVTTVPGGAKILESLLTSPGAYMTAAGPVAPGSISGISMLNIGNEQVYTGMELLNRAEVLAKGTNEALGSFIPLESVTND